jgi:SAM-dependent methyltransferase
VALHAPTTWHHGLVADYWAAVNLDAPELDLYRKHLRNPVLDAGCGTGRLLAPLCHEGFDVDGCDASADMIERCRHRVPDARLWVSTLHELDRPRRYASIICSGVLGLGSTREQDIRALKQLHDALLPGGTLVLDNEEGPFRWRARSWSEPSGGEISLRSRVDAVDEDDRCVHMTIRAETLDGRREEHALTMRQWYRDELVPLLHDAGFSQSSAFSRASPRTRWSTSPLATQFIAPGVTRHDSRERADNGHRSSLGPVCGNVTRRDTSRAGDEQQTTFASFGVPP